ncbi:class I SAM-dependent methyltransferase [Paracrocinitomix mangrovi]|uniref:class I SAM-dependent methyltransferase n=1 Tax=Paracrocinitomix mangrovi TaxID=2862509 RepID=UPI001C8EA39D|nr:rRNA adenine N-6-methyltransferase family protein [Paracrocinitomix mangrovi]UKN02374.1 class I SAM-dependent methyltransferase [Paracrocinitomix mangrovi]
MAVEKKHRSTFLNTFFSERKQVGAVAPSSRYLVKTMCNKIDFDNAKCIVELGPGTGAFTSEIIARANDSCKIILVELNETFYDILQNKFDDKRVIIVNRSADEIEDILNENGIEKADAVLSSLPLTVIPEIIKKRIIIGSFNVLKLGGVFIQYQYSLNAKKLLEMKYGKLKIGFVPMNVPPAFVYSAIKE